MVTRRNIAAGLTLVELLVVIVILVILVAVVLPLAQPTARSRVIREAARQVHGLLSAAKAKTVASGRPYGVLLMPSDSDAGRSFQLAMAKLPAPYSGEDINWRVRITDIIATPNAYNDSSTDEDEFRGRLDFFHTSNPGDLLTPTILKSTVDSEAPIRLRLNYRGRYLYGKYGDRDPDNPTTDVFYVHLPTSDGPVGADSGSNGLPFQIDRPPRKTAAAPLDLPNGAYIDLAASGGGAANTLDGAGDVALMFDADGRLANDEPYFLLIAGDAKPVFSGSNKFLNNLLKDVPAAWVTINGDRVSTTDNVGIIANPGSFSVNGQTYSDQAKFKTGAISISRDSARSGPTLGGR